ncbi:MAG: D-2-hydroxyacid dehydrogenase [Alphaproteobacteria bacterium]|nr:D-2-hydroxyacid dehydrogenase [Alphaproteobacteria bacterium]
MTNRTHVLLWTDTPAAYEAAIAEAGLGDRVIVETLKRSEMPSPAQCASVEAMLAWGAPAGVLPGMAKLRWAQSLTAGVESWFALPDLPAGLTLTCARGTHRESMPENILGALFHIAKPYAAIAQTPAGQWVRRMATPLAGKTLGILGLGAIGQDLARMASAIGMRVIGTRRGTAAVAHAEVYAPDETDMVLAQSDFVVLLLPATPETDNFINAERLAKMKPSAWLLNFGRGHLIRDDDLIAACKGKIIAGAILDVFRTEPLPAEHPLWRAEGIMVLPHIGGGHPQRDGVVARLFVDNLSRFLDGRPLRELVDRSAGY